MGRSEIGVSEEEKRKPSKSRKQFNEIFQINFAEVLAKPDSEFGVSERKKAKTSKSPKRADEKNLRKFFGEWLQFGPVSLG